MPSECVEQLKRAEIDIEEAIHATQHALTNIIPTCLLINSSDIGSEHKSPYATRSRPHRFASEVTISCCLTFRIMLFDRHGGSTGFVKKAFEKFESVLARGLHVVDNCDCEDGCPKCINLDFDKY